MKLIVIMCILESLGISNPNEKAIHYWDWSYEYPNIPYTMAIATGWHESKLEHKRFIKPNKTNDVGIMQINIRNWSYRCKGKCNLKKLRYNIKFGYMILNYGYIKSKGKDPLYYYNSGNKQHKKSVKKIMNEIIKVKNICQDFYK